MLFDIEPKDEGSDPVLCPECASPCKRYQRSPLCCLRMAVESIRDFMHLVEHYEWTAGLGVSALFCEGVCNTTYVRTFGIQELTDPVPTDQQGALVYWHKMGATYYELVHRLDPVEGLPGFECDHEATTDRPWDVT